jgi:uncharacterized peroxidase-related enzyme
MPRLNAVNPKTDSGPAAEFLNGPLKNKQLNIFKGIGVNANILKAFVSFAGAVKKAGALTDAEHEIVALVTGQKNRCDYCLAAHTKLAEAAGLTEEQTINVRKGEGIDDRTQALVDFVAAVIDTGGYISDEQLEAFRNAGYSDAAVVETLAAVGVNTFTNLFNHVHETEIDFPIAAAV